MMHFITALIVPKVRFFFVLKKSEQSKECPQKYMLAFGLAIAWKKRGTCFMGRACWSA